jgi:hypothetical protein
MTNLTEVVVLNGRRQATDTDEQAIGVFLLPSATGSIRWLFATPRGRLTLIVRIDNPAPNEAAFAT